MFLVHQQDLTEELAWALCDPRSEFRRGLVPSVDSVAKARRDLRERLASDWQALGPMYGLDAPILTPPHGAGDPRSAHHYVRLTHNVPKGYEHEPGREVSYPVFIRPRFRYFMVSLDQSSTVPADLNLPQNSAWFMDKVQTAVDLLQAEYAFCTDFGAGLEDPGLSDPRSRAWDLAYYGPRLAREIGESTLEQAQAQQVWSDHRGGRWVGLGELPFVPILDDGEARAALARHLRLAERFPDPPTAS